MRSPVNEKLSEKTRFVKRVRAKSIEKRRRILDAAAKIFAEKGYAEAKLSDIADEVDTYAGSIYYYFDSREHLVKAVLAESMRRMSDSVVSSLEKLPKESSYYDKIKAAARAQMQRVALRDDYSRATYKVADQLPAKLREEVLRVPREYAGRWKDLFKSAQRAGEIRSDVDLTVARLFILGAITWSADWYKREGPLTPEQLADQFVDMLFDGVSGKPSAARSRSKGKK